MTIPTPEELGIIVAKELGTHSNEAQRRAGRAVRDAVLEGAAREADKQWEADRDEPNWFRHGWFFNDFADWLRSLKGGAT